MKQALQASFYKQIKHFSSQFAPRPIPGIWPGTPQVWFQTPHPKPLATSPYAAMSSLLAQYAHHYAIELTHQHTSCKRCDLAEPQKVVGLWRLTHSENRENQGAKNRDWTLPSALLGQCRPA